MSESTNRLTGAVHDGFPLSREQRDLVAAWLKAKGAKQAVKASVIPARAQQSMARASLEQEQIWIHAQLAGTTPVYSEPVTVHYSGALDANALRKSLAAFIQRHSAWRTTFDLRDGELYQTIRPQLNVAVPFSDLSSLSRAERERRALKLATYDAFTPFDLSRGPLLRWRLVRFSEDEHRLYVTLHHIVFDGVSLYKIFLPELAKLYRAHSLGVEPELPQLVIDYPDYAEWRRREMNGTVIASQLEYWGKTLANLPELELKPDYPRSGVQSFRGSMERFLVPSEITDALKEVARQTNSTLFMVLTAVIALLLKERTGSLDIPIGSAASGRKWSETESVVGLFLNTIVLRVDASGDPTFLQLVERVREMAISALSKDDVPFSTVVHRIAPQRNGSRHPLFQVMFSLEPPLGELEPGWKFTQMDVETGITKFDLHLEMDDRKEGILARFIYNADLFKRQTILEMSKTYLRIARGAAANPGLPISRLVQARTGGLRERFLELFGTGVLGRAPSGTRIRA
jgi:hypothetical protein